MEFQVKDLGLYELGRKEIQLAEKEMPGLIKLRELYKNDQPLKNMRISGSLHMTVQTAVLIETLLDLGAQVRWASCNIYFRLKMRRRQSLSGVEGRRNRPEVRVCSRGRA